MSEPPAPILRDFPETFESERLVIRSPRPGDGAALHEAIVESLDDLRPWMPWAHEPQSPESAEAYARRSHADFLARRDLPLFLFGRDGAFIGGSGLVRIDWSVPRFEIGYWVRTSASGRGYATEAARRIAEFAFAELGAERVEIWCDAANERSAAVARSAGFAQELRMPGRAATRQGVSPTPCASSCSAPDPGVGAGPVPPERCIGRSRRERAVVTLFVG